MTNTIDLNADLGESYGPFKKGNDEQIIPLISSANIACGFHAGDYHVMDQAIQLCREHGTGIGAHPAYQDIMGFGRRHMVYSYDEIEALITYQIGALHAFCIRHGVTLNHVKPHGALYNDAAKDKQLSEAIVNSIYAIDPKLKVMGLSGSLLTQVAEAKGMTAIHEVFADRNYNDDGTLVSRTLDNAMIENTEQAIDHVLQMVTEGTLTTVTGDKIPLKADSICVHGDGAHALQFVEQISSALKKEGVFIKTI